MSMLALESHRRHQAFKRAIFMKAVADDGIDLKRPKKCFRIDPPEPVAPPFIAELEPPGPPVIRGQVSIRTVQRAVCKAFNVELEVMLSAQRDHKIIPARQVGMVLSKYLALKSLPEIGRRFGRRDHSTVHHAGRKLEVFLARLIASIPAGASLETYAATAFDLYKSGGFPAHGNAT